MEKETQRKIFAANLRRLMDERRLSQVDVASAIGVSATSLNNWAVGLAVPHMDKVQALASFFGVSVLELINPEGPEQVSLAASLQARSELRELLSVARKLSPADVRTLTALAARLGGGCDV